jgi:hypothetical protein
MASGDGDFICETCHKIDFQDLLQNPLQVYMWQYGEPSRHTMRYSKGCKLCLLMFQGVSTHAMEMTFELRSFLCKRNSTWTVEDNLDAGDSVFVEIGLQQPGFLFSYPPDDVFCKLASDGSQSVNYAQPVQDI